MNVTGKLAGRGDMYFYRSPSADPYYNLALEQHLFEGQGRTRDIFMLWQNDNTIVIGKNQNTEAEINSEFVKANGIKVVRRLSGGGAVYHDMGNLNFTFIVGDTGEKKLIQDFGFFCVPVAEALRELGVTAEISGRNDILIDGKKFSGNAQYRRDGRVLHHGTIMFASDLSMLGKALNVSREKLENKGVKSVGSRVTNVSEHLKDPVTLEAFEEVLKRHVLPEGYKTITFSEQDEKEITKLRDERYATWRWNYAAKPRYSVMKSAWVEGCGSIKFYLSIKDGRIEDIESFGDYFGDGDFETLAALIRGSELTEGSLSAALGNTETGEYFRGLDRATLIGILCG